MSFVQVQMYMQFWYGEGMFLKKFSCWGNQILAKESQNEQHFHFFMVFSVQKGDSTDNRYYHHDYKKYCKLRDV